MTSTAKATAATSLDVSAITDTEEIDASDVTTPFGEAETNIDEARETVAVSAGDTHVKNLEDAITAGTGVTVTKTNAGGDEALTIAADGANIGSLDAGNVSAGILAADYGGLGADASGFSGLIEMAGGVASVATAGTDYVTPTGSETLTNKTLTTPTVGDFTNATHDHEDAAGGGQITNAAIDSQTATSGHVLTANGTGGATWAAVGGGGATPIDITVTAGEALAERDIVFIDVSDGNAYKADADATIPLLGAIRGIVNESGGISSAATGSVRIAGEVSGFTGLTAWQPVYAATTAGGYTQTKPNPTDGGGQVAVVPMGYAVSTTAVMVDPKPVQYLKRETLADAATTTITHHADAQGRSRMVRAYVATDVDTDAASYGSANQDEDVQLRGESGAGGTLDINATGTNGPMGDVNGDDIWLAQSFVPAASGVLTQLKVTLGPNVGSPTGSITYALRADNGGEPGATNLITNTFTPTPSSENTITVTDGPFLDGSTTYWLILAATVTQTTNNRYTWRSQNTSTYANGEAVFSSDGGSTWATNASFADYEMEATTSAVTAKDKLAQSFELASGDTIDKARLWLKKVGSPTGTMTLRIETDSAGEPSGTLADANATVTVAESGLGTSYGWVEFDFASNFSLSGSTTYWLVLSTDRSASNSDYVEWGADGSTPGYADGEMQSEASSSWSGESKDAVFEVLKPVVIYDEPCVIGRSSGGTRDVGVRFDDGSGSDANTKTTFVNHMGGSADVTCVVELE